MPCQWLAPPPPPPVAHGGGGAAALGMAPPPAPPDAAAEARWQSAVSALSRAALDESQLQPVADATAESAVAAFARLPQVERMQKVTALLSETRAACEAAKTRGRTTGRDGESRSLAMTQVSAGLGSDF